MKQFEMKIGDIPAILYGSQSEKIFLFVHGQNGNKEEAWHFGEIVSEKGWQVLSIDLPEHGERKQETGKFFPWVVVPELQQVWAWMAIHWRQIALRADSIGAWFSMLAFGEKKPGKKPVGFTDPRHGASHCRHDGLGRCHRRFAGIQEDDLHNLWTNLIMGILAICQTASHFEMEQQNQNVIWKPGQPDGKRYSRSVRTTFQC